MVSGAPYSLLETVHWAGEMPPGRPVPSWFFIFTKTQFFAFFEFLGGPATKYHKNIKYPPYCDGHIKSCYKEYTKKIASFPPEVDAACSSWYGGIYYFFCGMYPGIIRAKSAMTLCMINNDTDSHEGYFSPCEPLYDK